MAYKAIYRKWRPMVFDDIVGQTHITQALRNQVTGSTVGHAYLFCGTRGTGKTTAAKILSRAVNCLNPQNGSPCNECEICRGILDGSIMDVTEIDAASNNGVDDIREIRDDTKYVTASAKYRIYIIDEVHMLSKSAFNALLKTLEEPPSHVIFILATTDPEQLPQTVISRCQRYDFRRIKLREIITRLKEIAYGEGFDITEDAYHLIARLGDGSMRDSISVLERIVSTGNGRITSETITESLGIVPIDLEFEMADALISGDNEKIFTVTNSIADTGRDLNVFVDSLISHFRNLLVCKATSAPEKLIDYSDEEIVRFKAMAENTTYERISYIINQLTDAKTRAKWIKSPRVIYEMAFVKMSVAELDMSNDAIAARMSGIDDSKAEILSRINELEQQLKNGNFTVNAAEEKKEEKPAAPKKEASARLYNPIPKDKLHSENPIVKAAKKWEKIVATIIKSKPFIAMAVAERPITIDNDGFILLYDRKKEMGGRNIAVSQIGLITDLVKKSTGLDLKIKIAFRDELEDYLVDYWALPAPEGGNASASAQAQELLPPDSDPLADVLTRMEDFVDTIDSREFLTFNREDEKFSQTSLDSDENETEEFFENGEMESEE